MVHMFPSNSIKKRITTFPEEVQDIVLEIRSLVAEIAPEATEKFHSKGMSYFFKERGGPVSAGICGISIYRDQVSLSFTHGAFIDDPKGLLVGNTKAKKYLEIKDFSSADWEYYQYLIKQHAEFDPTADETQEKIRKMLQEQ